MKISDIEFPTNQMRDWLVNNIETPGPWQLKNSLKEKINCLLHYHLAGCSAEALHVREYLCNSDPDTVWLKSLNNIVLPYIHTTMSEVNYG